MCAEAPIRPRGHFPRGLPMTSTTTQTRVLPAAPTSSTPIFESVRTVGSHDLGQGNVPSEAPACRSPLAGDPWGPLRGPRTRALEPRFSSGASARGNAERVLPAVASVY